MNDDIRGRIPYGSGNAIDGHHIKLESVVNSLNRSECVAISRMDRNMVIVHGNCTKAAYPIPWKGLLVKPFEANRVLYSLSTVSRSLGSRRNTASLAISLNSASSFPASDRLRPIETDLAYDSHVYIDREFIHIVGKLAP